MRKAKTLEAMFPKIRGRLLSAIYLRPEKWWFLSELAEHLRTSPSSLQRELASLVDSGLLQQRREGTRTYFKAETRSPIFKELRGLFEKTAGVVPTLRQTLEPFANQITVAFVYGSLARSSETAGSDIDLMVVGKAGLSALAPALRQAEGRLGREVNVTSYSVKEFRKKVAAQDHFLSSVVAGPKEFVWGNQDDLERLTG